MSVIEVAIAIDTVKQEGMKREDMIIDDEMISGNMIGTEAVTMAEIEIKNVVEIGIDVMIDVLIEEMIEETIIETIAEEIPIGTKVTKRIEDVV